MSFFFNPFGDDMPFGGRSKPKKEVDTTKLYKVLGVEKTADINEIKRAYKKLVRTKHPDKGGDQNEFQEIQKAYDILSDENKRKVYDDYGEEGIKEGREGGEEFTDPFSFFTGGGSRKNQRRRTRDVLQQIEVTLEELYLGKTKYIEITHYRICKDCKGTGAKDTTKDYVCKGCNGKRVKLVIQRMGNTILQSQQTCPECRGEGTFLEEKDKCKVCKGKKVVKENKQLKLDLDKGAKDGKRYKFEGESDEVPECDPGDVVVEIRAAKHKRFERVGSDLYYKADISLLEALTGFELIIKMLDDRQILVKTKPNESIQPGEKKCVRECGMPLFDNPARYGNLYIVFNVVFPKVISEEQKKSLKTLFPVKEDKEKEKIKSTIKEKYVLEDFNKNETNEKIHDDEDEEEDTPHGQEVRCSNQ